MKFPLKTLCSLYNTAVTVLKKVCYTFFKKKKRKKKKSLETKFGKSLTAIDISKKMVV